MKKNIPEIRFKEFTDEWTSTNLGRCFEERVERSGEGELISVTINYGVVRASDLDRIDNSSSDKSNYKKVEVGDIAYNSMRMWQGACGYSEYSGICSPAYTVVSPNDGINVIFFSYMFKRDDMLYKFRSNSQGLTSDTWNLKYPAFSKIGCIVPKEIEQQKISMLLKTLDKLISKLEQKVEKLKNIKQSLLNQMFTNENGGGRVAIEISFRERYRPWEKVELKDVAYKYSMSNSAIHHQNLLSLSYGKIVRRNIKSNKGLLPSSFDTYQIVKEGVIVMRFTDLQNDKKSLRIGLATEEGIVSPAYTCIACKDNILPAFLYLQLHFYDSVLKKFYSMGDGMRQTLSYNDIDRMRVYLPCLREQHLIVDLFDNLNNNIDLQEAKLTKIRNTKQSMLHKMFVNS